VNVRMPLQEIPRRRDRDDDAGAGLIADGPADELTHRLGCRPAKLGEPLAATPEERAAAAAGWSARHGGVRPAPAPPDTATRPKGSALLLARRAERSAAAGEGHQHAAPALPAPEPSEAMLDEPAVQELPQHPAPPPDARRRAAARSVPAKHAAARRGALRPSDCDDDRGHASWNSGDSRGFRGRYTRQEISTPSPRPGGESPAREAGGQPRLPRRRVSPGSVPSQVLTWSESHGVGGRFR